MREQWILFTDGACSGNPGPGGWGCVVVHPHDFVTEGGSFQPSTTNNQMEIRATIEALRIIDLQSQIKDIWLYTDSTYVIRGATQWIFGWMKRGWQTAESKPVQNKELWQELHQKTSSLKALGFKIDWRYSRGHTGIPGNERCDEIGVHFSKGQGVQLFQGPLTRYSIDILLLPENHEIPEMKEATAKPKAIGYLSLVNGVVVRHQDWPSCQRSVNGVSGAKFKKIQTESEVSDVLKSWGLSHSTEIKNRQ